MVKGRVRKCGHSGRYKATRRPTCMGGVGCPACWDKWHEVRGG